MVMGRGGGGPELPAPLRPVPSHPGPEPKPTTSDVRTPPSHLGSPAVNRAAAAAARSTPTTHPHVWQPWATAITAAGQQMRADIQAALKDLEAAENAAGQVLDLAEAIAAETSSGLRAVAWERWHKDMNAAANTAAAIVNPARATYTAEIEQAHAAYDKALTVAEVAYRSRIGDADRAKAAAPPAG